MEASLSQHPLPLFSVLHVSDTHLLGRGRLLHSRIDAVAHLKALLGRVVSSGLDVRALIFTGDLADQAAPEAYSDLRLAVEPYAKQLGAEVIWVMGNHDERAPFAEVLLDSPADGKPQYAVYDVSGLRVVVLDTSVPGYHHGSLDEEQLRWLRKQLSTPAPLGTVIALHHPPIPPVIDLMGLIELENQPQLWEAIEGSDVRAILAGHLHYSTHTVWRGVPVSVAAAMCYNVDLVAYRDRVISGVDFAQSSSLVSVFPEQVVFSDLPVLDAPELFHYTAEYLEQIRAMNEDQRRAVFSSKTSDFNLATDRKQAGE